MNPGNSSAAKPAALTVPQTRALTFLAAAARGMTPSELAGLMWPDTTGSGCNGSRGYIPNTGINLRAGSFLESLRRKGWTSRRQMEGYTLHYISAAGRDMLRTAAAKNKD